MAATGLADELDELINNSLPNAHVGVLIQEENNGKILYTRNANKYFYPASNIKLFTATAALYFLGTDYQYTTKLAKKGENIYFIFTGSPSLTINDLDAMVAELKKKKITVITGNIIIDDSRFKPPMYSGGVSNDDFGLEYTAPSSAIIINGNTEPFDFRTTAKIGDLVEINPATANGVIKIKNELIIATKDEATNHCKFNIEIKRNNALELYGCFEKKIDPEIMNLAVTDPFLYAKKTITNSLDKYKIHLNGNIIKGHTPPETTTIAINKSENLQKLLTHMLLVSDNNYAYSIIKQLGYTVTGEGTFTQGMFAAKKILQEHTTLKADQLALSDGFGSRYDLATPEQVMILLINLHQNKEFKPFLFAMLPHMGSLGTLKKRLTNTELTNKVFAKTGTMHDISALSGYMQTKSGKIIYFTILINNFIGDIKKAKEFEDILLIKVYNSTN